jgi:hypothetical protein
MNKRKRTVPAQDNPIIAVLRRYLPRSGLAAPSLDVDRPPDGVLDQLIAFSFNDATIREIGVLVVKALLTDDRQIVRIVEDALRESNHIFRRDRELVLRKKVVKYLPELIGSGLSIGAIKRRLESKSDHNKTGGFYHVSAVDSQGRTIWIVDAHGYGKRFIVRADEILTAFLEAERAIHQFAVSLLS